MMPFPHRGRASSKLSGVVLMVPLAAALVILALMPKQTADLPEGKAMAAIQYQLVDQAVVDLRSQVESNAEVRKKVTGDLPMEAAPILYRATGKHLDEKVSEAIAALLYEAVTKSPRYATKKPARSKPHVTMLEKSQVAVVDLAFPAVAVSDKEEKGELSVTVWLCPDRATALALAWLRAGGMPPDKRTVESMTLSSGSAILRGEPYAGELSFRHLPQGLLNAALRKGDARTLNNRVGFLRRNVVLETRSLHFYRNAANADWLTPGMTEDDVKELLDLLREVDRALPAPKQP
jgi:hypothetical protein